MGTRECENFKQWSEEFVNVECWFYGNKTGRCMIEEMSDQPCPWKGKPAKVDK